VQAGAGPQMHSGRRLPDLAAWLVCEQRTKDECWYQLTNHPEDTPLPVLATDIKAR
jgi:hypothetical protein